MRIIVNTDAMRANIAKASLHLKGAPIAVMIKPFYANLMKGVDLSSYNVFATSGMSYPTICATLGEATPKHKGAVTTNLEEATQLLEMGLLSLYVPVNLKDNREGLSFDDALELCRNLYPKAVEHGAEIYAMITSGCMRNDYVSSSAIYEIGSKFKDITHGLSIGGSYFVGRVNELTALPNLKEVRIGEYVLFGTIPYSRERCYLGQNAVTVKLKVVGKYEDRRQILVRGGYAHIDTKRCTLLSGGLEYNDSSSDYTIYDDMYDMYNVGDEITLVPNYKSLVKLQNITCEFENNAQVEEVEEVMEIVENLEESENVEQRDKE